VFFRMKKRPGRGFWAEITPDMQGNIGAAGQDDYDALINAWDDSVRATHDFLSEDDTNRLKLLIIKGFLTRCH
jgi:hypothetical protein